ncbi:hypothetical protein NQ318_018613 [Aromia moschata]|uniref:Laminin G domain-containing protein n=1 Tax=Aromia moschata TaxID=1265417 RepID=A0AAV8ZG23_9CUCU|nr:hypothetical protein NQ318_018613 [Aromia moschata]
MPFYDISGYNETVLRKPRGKWLPEVEDVPGVATSSTAVTFRRSSSLYATGRGVRSLVDGRLSRSCYIQKTQILLAGQNVNDNEFHTVRLSRRGSNLKLQLDSQSPIRGNKYLFTDLGSVTLRGRGRDLRPVLPDEVQRESCNSATENRRALSTEQSISGFPSIKVAAKFVKHATDNLHRPVTFRSKHTFIGLPMLRAYSSIHIDFMFKTREANGLIMFNGGKKEDFVAVELVDGHINYVVNVGDGTVTLRDTVKSHLNDNRWHTVGIRRLPGLLTHINLVFVMASAGSGPTYGVSELLHASNPNVVQSQFFECFMWYLATAQSCKS